MAAPKTALRRDAVVRTATIANGATTSGAISAEGFALFGLVMPAAFTGTSVTFTVAEVSDGTYQALYDNTGTAVSLTVAASRSLDLPSALASWPFFKVVSGSSEGAARTLKVVMKG